MAKMQRASLLCIAFFICCLAVCSSSSSSSSSSKLGNKRELTPDEIESSEFRGAVDAATIEMNRMSNSARFHAYIGTTHATKQLVSGVLYEFAAQFEETNCENKEHLLLQNIAACQPSGSADSLRFSCEFKVLHRPWLAGNEYRIVSEPKCTQSGQPEPRSQGRTGEKEALTEEDLKSDGFVGAKRAAEASYNANSRLESLFLISRVTSGTKQLVSGVIYEFNSEMMRTKCSNSRENYGKLLSECPFTSSQLRVACSHKLLYKPWAEQRYVQLSKPDCHVLH